MIISQTPKTLLLQDFLNRLAKNNVSLNDTQLNAMVRLLDDLEAIGLGKFYAVYPFIGGTAESHSLNLMRPECQILWLGSPAVTHDAYGATGSGAGWGDTRFSPLHLGNWGVSIINLHVSAYINQGTPPQAQEGIKAVTGVLQTSYVGFRIWPGWAGNDRWMANFGNGSFYDGTSRNTGHLIMDIQATDNQRLILDGQLLNTHDGPNTLAVSFAEINIYIMAWNNGGSPTEPTRKRLAFASYGTKLTLAEAVSFTAAVRNYQIALGRQI